MSEYTHNDDVVTRLNTEKMTKAFYATFPTVVTLEDAMRQALGAAVEIGRLRYELTQANDQIKLLIARGTAGAGY